jgi:uncharacterized membrane protein YgcG
MRRFSFSLRWLLGVVAFIAFGCAALLNAGPFWETTVRTLAWFSLLIATLAAIFRRATQQAFAAGFAIWGLAYVVLVFPLQQPLPTRSLLEVTYRAIEREVPLSNANQTTLLPGFWNGRKDNDFAVETVESMRRRMRGGGGMGEGMGGGGMGGGGMGGGGFRTQRSPSPLWFLYVGQWLWTLIIGFIGGLLARYLYATRDVKA